MCMFFQLSHKLQRTHVSPTPVAVTVNALTARGRQGVHVLRDTSAVHPTAGQNVCSAQIAHRKWLAFDKSVLILVLGSADLMPFAGLSTTDPYVHALQTLRAIRLLVAISKQVFYIWQS